MNINNNLKKYLTKIRELKREKHHALLHEVHKKHHISKKTLFYIKEYGGKSNVAQTIIRESAKILLLSSILSSFGGLALEGVQTLFLSIFPLVILLPALNDMIGSYGAIVSSRFSTMLYDGEAKTGFWKNKALKKLFSQIMILTFIGAILSSALALGITHFFSPHFSISIAIRVFLIVIIDLFLLTNILFVIAIYAGRYFYKKQEDPNNFLIPITTSVADFTNMAILSILILILF